ncbi:hypothetical protein Poly41_56840 [Novipirellula artificiosorum]|uniref:Translational regulator CsrA n=2 Tax=Novipirellula artificiosorum TaxID=2528016 RepID=A0A5C6DBC3_9BACT|nr:hypothetical protein Poly41_56840 [Novipirellula artificiosorum]
MTLNSSVNRQNLCYKPFSETPFKEETMLVLSRTVGERITIGDDVQIIITRVAGGRVSIGIDAPISVAVRRNELVPRQPGPSLAQSNATSD